MNIKRVSGQAICVVIFVLLPCQAADASQERILPVRKITVATDATDDMPAITVTALQNKGGDRLTSLLIVIDRQRHQIPEAALGKLAPVNLKSIEIRTEAGYSGKRWYTVVFDPAEDADVPTWYSISIVGDRYEQTTKSWDTDEGNAIRRHVDLLHKPSSQN